MAFDSHGLGQRPPRRTGRWKAASEAEPPRGLRARVRAFWTPVAGTLSGSGRVFALVWGASRPLTLLMAVVTIIAGLIPAAQAYAAKLLINAVFRAIVLHAQHRPDRAVLSVPLFWRTIQTPVV